MFNFSLDNQLITIILLVVLTWVVVLSFFLWRTRKHYFSLTKGSREGNLEKILEKLLLGINDNVKNLEEHRKELARVKEELPSFIQRVGLIRFNPYKEVGGDQSFSLAILDDKGSGVVISALHSRETTRMYAKPVKVGKETKRPLSEEEKEAISIAQRIRD